MRRCRKSLKKRKDERDNVFLLLVYIEPVSYTHLDVYKRQLFSLSIPFFFSFNFFGFPYNFVGSRLYRLWYIYSILIGPAEQRKKENCLEEMVQSIKSMPKNAKMPTLISDYCRSESFNTFR